VYLSLPIYATHSNLNPQELLAGLGKIQVIMCNENMFLGDPSWKLDVVGVVIRMSSLSTDYPTQYFGSGCPILYHCSVLPVPIQMKSQLQRGMLDRLSL